jgi:hypothetical protein
MSGATERRAVQQEANMSSFRKPSDAEPEKRLSLERVEVTVRRLAAEGYAGGSASR